MSDGTDEKKETKPFPTAPKAGEVLSLLLPVGSLDISQQIYKTIVYGAFLGKARKAVAKPSILNNPGKLITAVLAEVIDFPDTDYSDMAEKRLLCRHMYSADRSACVFAIRKATRQTPIIQNMDCPGCGVNLQVETTPDELDFIPLEDTKYKFDEKEREYLFKYVSTREDIIYFALPRGIIEEGLTTDELRNVGEAAPKILAHCIHSLNGVKIQPSFFDEIDTGYQDELTDVFSDEQPGWEMNKFFNCNECGTTIDYSVNAADFLLPNARRKRFSRRGKK